MSNKEMATEKRLKVRLYLSLLVYTVVGYGLTLILDYIFSKFDNGIFAWLYWRLDLLFILYLMLGFICIFNYYWKKPWGYLDEVIDATQTVYEQNNHTVSLSEPLKELEEQLNQIKMSVLLSKQAAKQAEEKKNEIIMYLAHDIRTPLTTVIGYLSLLHEAPDMPEQQKEKYVKVALNKAERLEKLINELFEITKYNAHTVIIKKETVDLHCLIAQVIDEIYPTLSANGNTAVFTAEDNLSVNADPEKLARVFSNLLRIARLKKGETINKLLYGGYSTISLGYAGLYECVKYMTGKSHTDPEATPFALEVMQHMNDACNKWKRETNIAFSIYGSPIESTTYKFAKCLQKRFGIIEGITDKNYITNSYHVHVTEPIDAFSKLKFESQFQALSTGGAISYVEVPDMQDNIPAVIQVMRFIYDNIMYAELNTKSDYCQECGYTGEIQIVEDEHKKLIWKCPKCGCTDQNKLNVARRTCGYIGTQFWNQGRTQEIKERVLHL